MLHKRGSGAGGCFFPAFVRVGFSYTQICLSFVSHDKIPTFIGPAMFDEAFIMYELGDGRYLDISFYGPKPLKRLLLDIHLFVVLAGI